MTSEYALEESPPSVLSKLPSAASAAKALHKTAPAVIASLSLDPAMRTPEGTEIETTVAARLSDVKAISEKRSPSEDAWLVLIALVADHNRGVENAVALMLAHGSRHALEVGAHLGDVALREEQRYRTVMIDGRERPIYFGRAFDSRGGESRYATAYVRRLGPLLEEVDIAERASLRTLVAARFDRLSPDQRRAFAWTFRDAEWSEASAREALTRDVVGEFPAGLLLAHDEALLSEVLERFVERAATELSQVWMAHVAPMQRAEVVESWLLRVLPHLPTKERPPAWRRLAQIRGKGAALALAEATADRSGLVRATRYFERHPDLAREALESVASRRGKKWDAARGLLALHEQAANVVLLDEVPEAEWPEVLRAAPWRAPKRPAIALAVAPLEVEEKVVERLDEPLSYKAGREKRAEEEYAKAGPKRASRYVFEQLPPARVRELLVRDGSEIRLHRECLEIVAARFGDELPSVCIDIALKWPKKHVRFFSSVRSVRAVHALLELCDDPIVERDALPGLAREAMTVGLALWPIVWAPASEESAENDANAGASKSASTKSASTKSASTKSTSSTGPSSSPSDETRHRAERWLEILRRRGLELELRLAAVRYGDEGKTAADAFFRRDPLLHYAPLPKTSFFDLPEHLPPLVMHDGRALPREAVTRVIEMLRVAGRDGYAGLDALRAAVTPESADTFAWALFLAWERAGMPIDEWPIFATGHLGGEACARGLDERARTWATNGAGVARMRMALEALARNGSPEALVRLRNAGQRSRYADTQQQVNELLDEIAASRGLTRDELHERLVPTLGLEAGWPVLDYGSQRFEVRVGEDLEVFLFAEGARLEKLPKPRKADDAALAKAAKERFAGLSADVREVVIGERRHFQRAMRSRRAWSREDFERFVAHPLLGRMVRGLVWVVDERVLRVDEAGGFADADDVAYVPEGRIRLAHPAIDDADALARMQALFLDYRILQPFPQLRREVFRLSDEEAASSRYEGLRGAPRRARDLLVLLEGGTYTQVKEHLRTRLGPHEVHVEVSPGLAGSWSESKQELGRVFAYDAAGHEVPFGTLDPLGVSEVLRDLQVF
ncbi:MAG: DUF4132 domain-containing protein [Sandaracinus sp.]|nr:DUF4132 domain-containing protein [Sandaracinus sp.]